MPYNFDINNIEHFGNDNIEHLGEPKRLEEPKRAEVNINQSVGLDLSQDSTIFKKRLVKIREAAGDLLMRTSNAEWADLISSDFSNFDRVFNLAITERMTKPNPNNDLEMVIFKLSLITFESKECEIMNGNGIRYCILSFIYGDMFGNLSDIEQLQAKLNTLRRLADTFNNLYQHLNKLVNVNNMINNQSLGADSANKIDNIYHIKSSFTSSSNSDVIVDFPEIITGVIDKVEKNLNSLTSAQSAPSTPPRISKEVSNNSKPAEGVGTGHSHSRPSKEYRPMAMNNEIKLINNVLDRANVVNNYKDLQTKTILTNIIKLITRAVPEDELLQDEAMLINNSTTIIDSIFNITDTLFPYTGNESIYQKYFTLYNRFLNPKQLKILFSNIKDNINLNNDSNNQPKVDEIIASYLHDFLSTKEIFDLLVFIVLYLPNVMDRIKKLDKDKEWFVKMTGFEKAPSRDLHIPLNIVAKIMTNILNDLEIPLEPFVMFRVFIEALMNSFVSPFDTIPEIVASTHLFNRLVLSINNGDGLQIIQYFFRSLGRVLYNTKRSIGPKGDFDQNDRAFLSKYMLKDYNKISIPDTALVKSFYNLIDNVRKISPDPNLIGKTLHNMNIFDDRVCNDPELLSKLSKVDEIFTKMGRTDNLDELNKLEKQLETEEQFFENKLSFYAVGHNMMKNDAINKYEEYGIDCTFLSRVQKINIKSKKMRDHHEYIKSESVDTSVSEPVSKPVDTSVSEPVDEPVSEPVLKPVDEPFKNSNLEGFSKYRTINMILIVGILLVVILGYFYYKNNMSDIDDINFELTETPLMGNNMDIDMDYNFD